MGAERIVSLLPGATEWILRFGGGGLLVGRSHACTFPEEVLDLPAFTSPVPAADVDPADAPGPERIGRGLTPFAFDLAGFLAVQPTLVVTQTQCAACMLTEDDLVAYLGAHAPGIELFSFSPDTFKEVLDAALRLGRRIGRGAEAMQWIAAAERAVALLRRRIGLPVKPDPGQGPRVVCLEWLDPCMTIGHWAPDVVALAGGHEPLGQSRLPSTPIPFDRVVDAAPDLLMLAPCGCSVADTVRQVSVLKAHPGWEQLPAVRNNLVFALDGRAFLSRPGPRLYRAVALLARLFYPAAFPPGASSPPAFPLMDDPPGPEEIARINVS